MPNPVLLTLKSSSSTDILLHWLWFVMTIQAIFPVELPPSLAFLSLHGLRFDSCPLHQVLWFSSSSYSQSRPLGLRMKCSRWTCSLERMPKHTEPPHMKSSTVLIHPSSSGEETRSIWPYRWDGLTTQSGIKFDSSSCTVSVCVHFKAVTLDWLPPSHYPCDSMRFDSTIQILQCITLKHLHMRGISSQESEWWMPSDLLMLILVKEFFWRHSPSHFLETCDY